MKILHIAAAVCLLSLIAASPTKKSKVNSPLFSGYKFVPKGEVLLDVKPAEVDEFYISATEISNGQYQTFLNHLKQQNRVQDLNAAMLDTAQWRNIQYGEPFSNSYHSHKAYEKYPCVGMSYEGAKLYCAWLKEMLEAADSRYTYEVKLPNKNQWIYAAAGGKRNSHYSWGGPYMKNKLGTLCNFRDIGANSIHFDEATGKYIVMENQGFDLYLDYPTFNPQASFTAPVLSYIPNGYGLYNVCGNVEEMIDEKGIAMGGSFNSPGYDVRVRSERKYTGAAPTIGFRPIIILKEK